jgi:hypothetical protein
MTPQAEVILRDGNKTFTAEVAENAERKNGTTDEHKQKHPSYLCYHIFLGNRLMRARIASFLFAIALAAVVGCQTATAERCETLFCVLPPRTYFDGDGDEGKLDRFKEYLGKEEKTRNREREERKDRKDRERSATEDYDEEDDIAGEFFLKPFIKLMVRLTTYPFAYDAGYSYLSYPYESEDAACIKTAAESGNFGFTGFTDYQFVSSKLYGLRGFVKLQCPSGAFIDTSYTRYEEEVSDSYDHLNIFKFHVGYSLVTDEKFIVEPYIGTVSFPGEKIDTSFDIGISLDYFFQKPLRAYLSAGNSFVSGTYMADLEGGFGMFYKNLEARIGYRSLISEDEDISGPIIGISLWF